MVLFASGDGGWKGFEDRICQSLARQGYCVVGWDCLAYSKPGFYDQKTLASDFDTAIRSGAKAVGAPRAPLVMAGYSTGAEQVVAAAAASQRPSGLCGVVAIAPGWRGRYGITTSDLMGIAPSGEASFALEEHAPGLAGLRFFQIHGEHDPLAQTDWLKTLTIPHKLAVYPNGWHTFGGGPEDFQTLVCQAVGWVKSGRP